MKSENWIAVAAIIVTVVIAIITMLIMLICAVVSPYIQYKLSQINTDAETTKPTARDQKVSGWFMRLIHSSRLNVGLILISSVTLAALLLDPSPVTLAALLLDPSPVTRFSVFAIALSVGNIYFNLHEISLLKVYGHIFGLMENDWKTIHVIEKLGNVIAERLPENEKGSIDKLVGAMKALVGFEQK